MEKELSLILDNMDFTGSRSSWFDNWSTGFDWEGEGNKKPEVRVQFGKQLLKFYNEARFRLRNYPKEYQLWIEIWEKDSSRDSVYIHTPNPNKSAFPSLVKGKTGAKPKDPKLAEFMAKSKLTVAETDKGGSKVYLLFDPQVGISPVKM